MPAIPPQHESSPRRNRDENNRKIFVGSLDSKTTRENLVDYFGQFGHIVDCVVMTDSQGTRSRGFGFVTFKESASVEQVLASGPHEIAGRTVDPKRALPRQHHDDTHHQQPRVRKVFLGGLPHDAKEPEIREFFSKYGAVEDVIIQYDRISGRPRGFGFVVFDDEAPVDQLVSSSERVYIDFKGKRVEIKRAFPKEAAPRTSTSRSYQGHAYRSRHAGDAFAPGSQYFRPNYPRQAFPYQQQAAFPQQMMQRFYSPYYGQFPQYAPRPTFEQFAPMQPQFYDPTHAPVEMRHDMGVDDGMQAAQMQFPAPYDASATMPYMTPGVPLIPQTPAQTQAGQMPMPMQQAAPMHPQQQPPPQGGHPPYPYV